MAYKDTHALMVDEQLLERLTVACADVARDVFAETVNVPSASVYNIRRAMIAYAGPSSQDFRRFAREIALVVLVVGGVTLASNDAALKTAVANLWTTYARILERKGVIKEV